jgi:hypothetical protein
MKYHRPDLGGWDLWRDGISVTALQTSLVCFEQFRLSHCLGYQPRVVPAGPAFGRLIHYLLEHTQSIGSGKKYQPPAIEEINQVAGNWHHEQKKNYVGVKRREQLMHIVSIATAVFYGYTIRYRGDWLGKSKARVSTDATPSKWVGFEQSFSLPYLYPDGKIVEIRGRWDALCECQRKLRAFETKCWSVIKPETIVAMLSWDFQYNLYLYALTQMQPKTVGGLILNVVRRPGHTPHINESKKDFWHRLTKEVANPSKWDHYFQRFSYDVTALEMQRWASRQLFPVMERLRLWSEGKMPHSVNPTSLISQYGPCFMFDPIVNLDYSNFTIRKKRHGKTRKS